MTTATDLRQQGTGDVLAADTSVTRGYGDLIAQAVEHIAYFGGDITAETVREHVEFWHPGAQPHHPNLIGAKFRELAQAGRIKAVGWTEATRPESRGRALRVWRAVA